MPGPSGWLKRVELIDRLSLAVELGYDARKPVDHPTPLEPTECFKLTRKGSRDIAATKKARKTEVFQASQKVRSNIVRSNP